MVYRFLFLAMLFSTGLVAQRKPNILLITCEDISPFIGSYGDKLVKTPHIDQLAAEGVRYTNMFTTAGVCAPSRSTIITGIYPMSIGTQHMRTIPESASGRLTMPDGVPAYSAVLPEYVKAFPEFLRRAGYYTTNNAKTDYQFIAPVTVWDDNSKSSHYRNRAPGQPFFAVFNNQISHEAHISLYRDSLEVDPALVNVPPYYPDTKEVRTDIARVLTNVQAMDRNVGKLIQQLKDEGLYDSTIIIFFSDHGGPLPWMKREVLDRGLRIPFIVRYPNAKYAGKVVDDLVSSVDIAPSILSLAAVSIPSYMQGKAFLGASASDTPRKYIHACKDRMDEKYDRVRMVRDLRYAYVYNYETSKPGYMDIAFRVERVPMMKNILELRDAGKLDTNVMRWFKIPKDTEELYDCQSDPYQLHNLANDPRYADKLKELRSEFQRWTKAVGDLSATPEKEMVAKWWNGKQEPPTTAKPSIKVNEGMATVTCATRGASIGYRIIRAGSKDKPVKHAVYSFDGEAVFSYVTTGKEINGEMENAKPVWNIYSKPVRLMKGDTLVINAHRIGFKESTVTLVGQ